MNRAQQLEYAALLEEQIKRNNANKLNKLWQSMYPWQRRYNASTATNRASALMAANQVGKCVSYSTLIETDRGPLKIGDVFGSQVNVLTYPHKEPRKVVAWVRKPPEECYRITLDDGSWVECPLGHRILVGPNYLTCGELFQALPESVVSRPLSNSESFRSVHALGVQRLMRTPQDCLDDCSVDSRLRGAQLLSDEEGVQVFAPLPAYARPRTGHLWRLGGLARKCTDILSGWWSHQSSLGGDHQPSGQSLLHSAPSCACADQYKSESSQTARLSSIAARPEQSGSGFDRQILNGSWLALASPELAMAANRIVSVVSVGYKTLYDMEVEDRHNYIAGGLVHHNTRTGTAIDAFHLTGDYPDDWDGHRFNFAPLCWLLGYSGEKTRDLLQSKLFGRLVGQAFEGGLIPADRILDYKSMSGTSGACREVRVRHRSGGIAVCQFWSYSQGQHALMGDVVDWFHIDEEPEDQEIFPQVLTRTINGDLGKGGRGILTFTPENGKTELVCKFMDEPDEGMYLQTATWDDAPHLNEDAKRQILSIYPEYQRAMRSRGVPLMGAGLIYEHAQSEITCKRFQIPDHFYLINGLDFGWDHPQAHVQLAIDPDSATIYITQAWKKSKKQPFEAWESVKQWCKDIPTAWPADGLQTEKGSAKQQKDYYEEAGWNMLDDAACWVSGGNGVEAGLMQLNSLMLTGKFKIFDDLTEVIEEVREYHRKQMPSGLSQIVKTKDDLVDACFHPDTKVMTEDGPCRIADMVGTDGWVVSIGGELQRYTNCRRTRENAEVIRLHFSDGTSVICTPDHQFLTVNGWVDAIHLHDEIIVGVGACPSYSTARSTPDSGGTTEARPSCIGIYGSQFMDLFPRSITFITSMAAQTITQLKTWSASLGRSIWPSMQAAGLGRLSATAAVKTSTVTQMDTIGFAAMPVRLPQGVELGLMTSGAHVHGANQSSLPINTPKSPIAAGDAHGKHGSLPPMAGRTLRVLRIESAGKSDVYCMEVPETEAFALENGAIVHNCRYAFMMARHAIQKAELTRNTDDDYEDLHADRRSAMGY